MATSVSSVVQHFPEAENGFTTTTAGSVSSGATTVTLNSVAGYTNGEPVVLVIDPTDASKKQTFTGIVDTGGVQITDVVWTAGTNQTHALGATVVDYATATHISMISKGIKVHANQDGTMIASLPLTTPKITTSINDANGNEVIKTPATSSAVNEITVTNAATGNSPRVSATGGDTNIALNLRGKGTGNVNIGAGATQIFPYDYVVSGCVWSGDAYGSTRVASMTSGVVVVGGNSVTVAAVTSRTFTASKDTYVDILDAGDGTGTVVYTEANNNAASPALAASSVRIAIIVTGAGNIANVGSVNQGEETKVLPIASSIPYAVTDSLGNLICPRDPNRKILGYRQIVASFTTTANNVDTLITGMTVPVIVPTNRKIRIKFFCRGLQMNAGAPNAGAIRLWEGTVGSGTQLADQAWYLSANGSDFQGSTIEAVRTPSSASQTYNISIIQASANTKQITAGATDPAFVSVELV